MPKVEDHLKGFVRLKDEPIELILKKIIDSVRGHLISPSGDLLEKLIAREKALNGCLDSGLALAGADSNFSGHTDGAVLGLGVHKAGFRWRLQDGALRVPWEVPVHFVLLFLPSGDMRERLLLLREAASSLRHPSELGGALFEANSLEEAIAAIQKHG